ncbi:response regulator receiver protein [Sphingobium sp. SYK-6]|uniref:response regulator transcription factor n=1 Tax=Sphingobium sp. (strain NBRC 103272 / SYK-6) TaxID=627192 RepID=UPI00022766F6|nr:response regulator [Sphingobium sp. SYK-6]BAK65751.1 response regulator receiver protein [Sphingobium sp. SYK-6]
MTAKPLISVVDDDAAIRIGLSSLIRSEGYEVALFESAEAFLASGASGKPGCLLTDIQMPGMSGLDLQARIRVEHPALPVLVMTAFPEEAMRQRALSAGAVCFLSKPFDAQELLRCLRRALGER